MKATLLCLHHDYSYIWRNNRCSELLNQVTTVSHFYSSDTLSVSRATTGHRKRLFKSVSIHYIDASSQKWQNPSTYKVKLSRKSHSHTMKCQYFSTAESGVSQALTNRWQCQVANLSCIQYCNWTKLLELRGWRKFYTIGNLIGEILGG